jgi:hypothetical protein
MSEHQSANPQELIQHIVQATDSLTDQEAARRYQQILAQLPPDQATKLNALALSQASHGERHILASQFREAHDSASTPFDGYHFNSDDAAATPLGLGQMSARAQQQDPALFGNLLGENSSLGGKIGKAALAALAALLIRQLLNNQQNSSPSGQGVPIGGTSNTDLLSTILSSLLSNASSGSAGGQPAPGGSQPAPGGSTADPLSQILGSLLGGASGGQGGGSVGGQPAPGGSTADPLSQILGALLSSASSGPASGPVGGSASNQPAPSGIDIGKILDGALDTHSTADQAPQGGGLGGLLGSILGGTTSNPNWHSHRR